MCDHSNTFVRTHTHIDLRKYGTNKDGCAHYHKFGYKTTTNVRTSSPVFQKY